MRILALFLFIPFLSWGVGLSFVQQLGNGSSLLQAGATAAKLVSANSGLFEPGNGQGKVVSGVNLFTGRPSYTIGLGAMSVRGVSFPLTLNYAGNAKYLVQNDNATAPTSWVGLGFNFSFPFVAINHKGTKAYFDDALFCDLGPYGGGQLLLDNTGTRYFVSSNPLIKVAFDTATSGEYSGQFVKWTFTFPDGRKMAFGVDTNAQRYVQYNQGLIKASPFSWVPSQKFIYRWDLSSYYDTIPNRPPKNKIDFEYARYFQSVSANKDYVLEAYPKNIKWMDGTQEVARYEFKTAVKDTSEYVGYGASEPKDDQRLYETRRLDTLKSYKEGVLDQVFKFDFITQAKALLDKIRVFYPSPWTGALVQDSGWAFNYDAAKFNLLSSVKTPASRADSYTYAIKDVGSSQGGQDPLEYPMLRADNASPVLLPLDTAKLAKWSFDPQCDERFCYLIVRDGDSDSLPGDTIGNGHAFPQKVYVEVKRNLGNYFDSRAQDSSITLGETVTARIELGDPWSTIDDWKIMPAGNYFLVVNTRTGWVQVNEFDGVKWTERFPFQGDSRYSSTSYFGGPIQVVTAPTYFLVQTRGQPSQVIAAVRTESGWTSLNRNDVCTFTNKGYYGDAYRVGSHPACLEWINSSLRLTAMPGYFLILDSGTNIINVYALDKKNTGFRDISGKFEKITSPNTMQMAGSVMNWEKTVTQIFPAPDYFLVESKDASNIYLNGFFFDGDTLKEVVNDQRAGGGVKEVFTSADYFVVADSLDSHTIWFWQKASDANHPISFQRKTSLRTDYASGTFLLVRTHPTAFSVEYYANSAAVGLRPKWESTGSNYASYLYAVNPSYTNGVADRSSALASLEQSEQYNLSHTKLFNISFSPSDNVLAGTSNATSAGARCSESVTNTDCASAIFSVRTHPNDLANYLRSNEQKLLDIPNNEKDALSQVGRFKLDVYPVAGDRIYSKGFQFDGRGFGSPDSQYVVTDFISNGGLSSEDRNQVHMRFTYAATLAGISEFNSHTQTPQFNIADVQRVNSALTSSGTARTFFRLDTRSSPLSGKSTLLNGTVLSEMSLAANGDTLNISNSVTVPFRSASWPAPLYIPQVRKVISQQFARNRSRISDTTNLLNYSLTNNSPQFVLNTSRPGKILLTQNRFDSLGLPIQNIVYGLTTKPDTAALEAANPTSLYSTTAAIASSKSIFQGYSFIQDSVWRATPSLSDAALKSGTVPVFRVDTGWVEGGAVTRRDSANYFQVVETRSVKSKLTNGLGESYSSNFYEGLRSDPVASISHSKLANCAVLMGENGDISSASSILDKRGLWTNAGGEFSNSHVHTGRYSIRITDNLGPTVKIYLKDVRSMGFGIRASAWIYSDSIDPVFVAERWTASTSRVDTLLATPAGGALPLKKGWQRWELVLSNAALTANNLFNGNNDYLRIYVGTGATRGNSNRVVYVDDIVVVPTNASFTLTTYDRRGIPTSSTDAAFRTRYFDIGYKGQVTAVRDDKYRIFSQAAFHAMGEN